ncbi:hypothetical protein PVL29_014632 [Vitis rotundifolia]|uniref:Uncharacterized protein n=1 Tax=Vitis rotundifolia TaxID=103349 RepID=A0AA39DM87_VITRO|nr:hypothetical protein PVL29_014632 [Vitis rotundifolia]
MMKRFSSFLSELVHDREDDGDQSIMETTSQSSHAGIGAGAPGHYAPTVPGGQPRPTSMAPQPIPIGVTPEGYAADDEETMKLGAGRGGRAGGWSTRYYFKSGSLTFRRFSSSSD